MFLQISQLYSFMYILYMYNFFSIHSSCEDI